MKSLKRQIRKFKEKILGCKTLFEAMRVHTTALAQMSEDIHPSSSNDFSERKGKS